MNPSVPILSQNANILRNPLRPQMAGVFRAPSSEVMLEQLDHAMMMWGAQCCRIVLHCLAQAATIYKNVLSESVSTGRCPVFIPAQVKKARATCEEPQDTAICSWGLVRKVSTNKSSYFFRLISKSYCEEHFHSIWQTISDKKTVNTSRPTNWHAPPVYAQSVV